MDALQAEEHGTLLGARGERELRIGAGNHDDRLTCADERKQPLGEIGEQEGGVGHEHELRTVDRLGEVVGHERERARHEDVALGAEHIDILRPCLGPGSAHAHLVAPRGELARHERAYVAPADDGDLHVPHPS